MGDEHVLPGKRRVGVNREPTHLDAPPISRRAGPYERRGFAAMPELDLGEVAVGSRRWFDACQLLVADGFRGHASVLGIVSDETFLAQSSDGSSTSGVMQAFTTDAVPPRVLETEAASPLRVRFHPTTPGAYSASIDYRADWSDRRVDHARVVLRARAVPLEDIAPKQETSQTPHFASPEQESKDQARSSLEARDQLAVATTEATQAALALGTAQREGVTNAENEARSFRQPDPEAEWWMGLAEIAISMGTATIASILGRKVVDTIVTKVVGKTVNEVKDLARYYSVIDTIKDGVKSGRRALRWEPGKAGKAPPNPQPGQGDGRFSSNHVIDFWAHQARAANERGEVHGQVVADTQAAMLAQVDRDASLSVAIMRGLRDVFRSAKEQATVEQQLASESQWVAGVARASLEEAREKRTPTLLDPSLEDQLYRAADGIVRLRVTVDEEASSVEEATVTVTSASVTGVSQEIADQLATRSLAQFPIPVLIDVAPGRFSPTGATIRREADGTLHASGRLPYVSSEDESSVRENVRAQIASKALAKRFGDETPPILSNDKTGVSDP